MGDNLHNREMDSLASHAASYSLASHAASYSLANHAASYSLANHAASYSLASHAASYSLASQPLIVLCGWEISHRHAHTQKVIKRLACQTRNAERHWKNEEIEN